MTLGFGLFENSAGLAHGACAGLIRATVATFLFHPFEGMFQRGDQAVHRPMLRAVSKVPLNLSLAGTMDSATTGKFRLKVYGWFSFSFHSNPRHFRDQVNDAAKG